MTDKLLKKCLKKESYNKKCIPIGKKVLENFAQITGSYEFLSYEMVVDEVEKKLKIDIDEDLLQLIIDELVDNDKEYWIKKAEGIYLQE